MLIRALFLGLVCLALPASAQSVVDSLRTDAPAPDSIVGLQPNTIPVGEAPASPSAEVQSGESRLDTIPTPRPDTARVRRPAVRAPSAPAASPFADLIDALGSEVEQVQASVSTQVNAMQRALSPVRLLVALLLLIVAAVAVGFVGRVLAAAGRRWPRSAPRLRRAAPFVRFGLWGLAVWTIAGFLFGASSVLVVLLGLLLFALSVYALAPSLRDVAAGAVLLLERRIEAGADVVIGKRAGRVERVGLRTVRLLLADGEGLTIPNSRVLGEVLVSDSVAGRAHRVEVHLPAASVQRARDAALASAFVAAGVPVESRSSAGGGVRVVAYAVDAASVDALASDIARLVEERTAD